MSAAAMSVLPEMRRLAGADGLGGVALVNEETTSDRLKKAAWERMKAAGQIPEKDVEAHRRAGRVEKRSIINNAIVRLPDGSYELALQNSAVLQQVFHAH